MMLPLRREGTRFIWNRRVVGEWFSLDGARVIVRPMRGEFILYALGLSCHGERFLYFPFKGRVEICLTDLFLHVRGELIFIYSGWWLTRASGEEGFGITSGGVGFGAWGEPRGGSW